MLLHRLAFPGSERLESMYTLCNINTMETEKSVLNKVRGLCDADILSPYLSNK